MSTPPHALIREVNDWRNGTPVLQSELSALDVALSAAVNGEGGGTYAMGGNVEVGGAGVLLAASPDHVISGAGALIRPVAGKSITHADGDYTLLTEGHPGRARAIVTSLSRAKYATGWTYESVSGAPQSKTPGAELMMPLRVHDGARLVTATLRFHVTAVHDTPALVPKFRILRIDQAGQAVAMTTNALNGFVYAPRPTNPTTWYVAGATRTIVLASDPAVIDVDLYTYHAHVVDEGGAGAAAGNVYVDVQLAFDSIADMRPQ